MATILMFAGDFAPRFWAFCNGQTLAIAQNQALFALLGTTYGGNGITTFMLPNLNGRTIVGVGQGPGLSNIALGQPGGSNTVVLTTSNLPAHTHTGELKVASTSNGASTEEPYSAIPGGVAAYTTAASASGSLGGVTATVNNSGGGQPLDIRQPYLGMNFVICLSGIFPSRS